MRSRDNQVVTMKTRKVREFNVIIERDSAGYYVASVPALPGCHTQAKSLDKLMERIHEAIGLCLEARQPDSEPLEFVGVQKVSVAE
jgi:predicted RNase H-like HicB family nuclease